MPQTAELPRRFPEPTVHDVEENLLEELDENRMDPLDRFSSCRRILHRRSPPSHPHRRSRSSSTSMPARPPSPSRNTSTACSSSTSASSSIAASGPKCSTIASSTSPSSPKSPQPPRRPRAAPSAACSCASGSPIGPAEAVVDGQGPALRRRAEPAHRTRRLHSARHPPGRLRSGEGEEVHRPHLAPRHTRRKGEGRARLG